MPSKLSGTVPVNTAAGLSKAVRVSSTVIIPRWLKNYIKPESLEKISEAVRRAELTTQGEIIPMVVRSSELFEKKKTFWNILIRPLLPLEFHYKLVDIRAELEFYRHYQGKTEHRTAILIFVSLLEHRAVVLADKAIAQKLPPETWTQVVQLLTEEMKKKDLATGMIRAIEKCSQILTEHFPAQKENPNELSNSLVIKE